MASLKMFVVDAFSDRPFAGNQAAVCLVNRQELTYERQLKISSEMKHSETAFVQLINDDDSYDKSREFNLRWFTPATEVPLCGHATLASAAVLFNCLGNKSNSIDFHTLSGQLSASKKSRESDVISLDFPLNSPSAVQLDAQLNKVIELSIGNLPTADVQFSEATRKLLIRLGDSEFPIQLLRSVTPDFKGLLECRTEVKGVIVTAKKPHWGNKEEEDEDDDGVDFYSRYFAPWVGIEEDPVTGSAHTVLAPYWAERLKKKNLKAIQCSERTGVLWLTVKDGRCEIMGKSFVVLQGLFTF